MEFNLKNSKYLIGYFFIVCMILFNKVSLKSELVYIDSTLYYIRTINIILSFLALSGIYIIYNKNKNSIIFLLSLMYLVLLIDIGVGNVDYFIFNNQNFSFSNYIDIIPSLLRIVILIIAINPTSKIHKFMYKHAKASIFFVITYCFVYDLLENIFNLNILIEYNYLFILYNLILIIIYINSSLKIWKLAEKDSFILKYFSGSILLLAIKAIYAIYGFFNINFNVKLTSVSITSVCFLIIIVATGIKLNKTIDEYNILTDELMKYFSFVENNKYINMFICDYDINVTYVNKKIEEYYNFKDPIIRFKNDVLQNEYFTYKLKEIMANLNDKGHWSGIIKDFQSNSILDCYIQNLDTSNGKKEMLVSYIDIKEKLDLEQDLENIKLREVKKDEFIANMSHELKTPINIFYSTLQLLDSYSENENIDFKNVFCKHRNSLKLNCKRMIRLVNNIVDISRIDLGTLKPNYGNYNIVSLVEDLIDSIRPFATYKDLTLEFDTNLEEHYLMCDPLIIERIVLNLLSNSIKYSERNKGIYILVSVEEDVTKISVRDEGCGIDLEKSVDIFDRFTRIDNSLTRLNEGSGIGLSIVKSMIDLIGGEISVKSELAKGSVFEISLPNKLLESEHNKNYEYDGNSNISIELSDIYEIN